MINLNDIIRKDKGEKDRLPLSSYIQDPTSKELEYISTGMITLDLGISAKIRGGIPKGHIVMVPGPSKMGKTFITMSVARNAQKKGMSVVIIDTERGYSRKMAEGFGLDTSPEKFALFTGSGVNSIEAVKGILVTISEGVPLNERENILVIIDSWGAFVTMKTIKDAQTGNTAADMSEAKMLNNLANVLLCTGFTALVTNHVYQNTGISFGNPTKIRGGTRIYYLSSAVILGAFRSTEKDENKEVTGTVVTCQNEKGRLSKEFLKFEFRIKMPGGLDMFYGLLPFALESGIVQITKEGNSKRYIRACVENDRMFKEDEVYSQEFWKPIFKDEGFCTYLERMFAYSSDFDDNSRFFEEEIDAEGVEVFEASEPVGDVPAESDSKTKKPRKTKPKA